MINCPNCNIQNDPEGHYCINCGYALTSLDSQTNVHRRLLGVATGRLVIALLLVWLLRSIFNNLSFVAGLRFAEWPFTVEQIITFIAYVVALGLLIAFVQTLRSNWHRAYPRLASLTPALTVIIYVIVLSFVYRALLPIIGNLITDPGDFVLILRVVLTVLAFILLAWAGKVIYDALPNWLSGVRFNIPAGDGE